MKDLPAKPTTNPAPLSYARLRLAIWISTVDHMAGCDFGVCTQRRATSAAGKLADLIVLDRDPLADIRNTTAIRYVMKNGRLYEGATLNEVYPRQRALAPFWWWDDAPSGVPGVER